MMRDSVPMEYRPKVRYWIPASAVNEADLRREVRELYDRGFGGLEIVVLQSVPQDVLLSPDGWGTERWDQVVAILNDETKKLGMSLDLAAGPGWPIASPVLKTADDPGVLTELTYGFIQVQGGICYEGPLPERRTVHAEGTPDLLAVMAYRVDTSDPRKTALLGTKVRTVFGEREYRLPLLADSYIDLLPFLREGRLSWNVPGTAADQWLIFAFYSQPAVQKINGGNTYVVDHLSREGAQAVAEYWEPILKSHAYDAMESLFCDSLEYEVSTDWTPRLPEEFRKRRGYDLLPYLPFIGMVNTFPTGDVPAFPSEPARIRGQINNDFSEVITQLYCEYHLAGLERMAEKYGKTVRYQVAYNKPFEEERCGLFVGIPENEALGRAQLDGQRLMAAAAHLGRKKRYSFECAAEFGQCYGQGYEDLLWWVKRSLMAGMNAQVLHGASYSGDVSGSNPESSLARQVQWPGYEGFGKVVTNNWNRTPDIAHARGCLDAVSRMNRVFRNQARIDLAVFRQAYENNGNGPDFYLYSDNGALANRGYSYEYLSDYLLRLPETSVSDGELDRNGAGYRALIVPEQECMSAGAMETILALSASGLPVVLAGKAPKAPLYYSECRNDTLQQHWKDTRRRLFEEEHPGLLRVNTLEQVPDALGRLGIRPRATLEGDSDVMTAVRREEKENRTWYAFYGYNRIHTGEGFVGPGDANPVDVKPVYQRPGTPSRRKVPVCLEGTGRVRRYDPWSGDFLSCCGFTAENGCLQGSILIEEDEMVILCVDEGSIPTVSHTVPEEKPAGILTLSTFAFYEFGPDTPGETSFLRSRFAAEPCFTRSLAGPDALIPWTEMSESLTNLAGMGKYSGELTIDTMPADGQRLILCLGDVYDTFTVTVNGVETSFPDQVMKQADLTGLVHPGVNSIEIHVVSELHNLLMNRITTDNIFGLSLPPYLPRRYGIFPSETKPISVFLTGCGKMGI